MGPEPSPAPEGDIRDDDSGRLETQNLIAVRSALPSSSCLALLYRRQSANPRTPKMLTPGVRAGPCAGLEVVVCHPTWQDRSGSLNFLCS